MIKNVNKITLNNIHAIMLIQKLSTLSKFKLFVLALCFDLYFHFL